MARRTPIHPPLVAILVRIVFGDLRCSVPQDLLRLRPEHVADAIFRRFRGSVHMRRQARTAVNHFFATQNMVGMALRHRDIERFADRYHRACDHAQQHPSADLLRRRRPASGAPRDHFTQSEVDRLLSLTEDAAHTTR